MRQPHAPMFVLALLGCGSAVRSVPPDADATVSSTPTPDARAAVAWPDAAPDAPTIVDVAPADVAPDQLLAPDFGPDQIARDAAPRGRPEDQYPLVGAPVHMLVEGFVDLIAIDDNDVYWSTQLGEVKSIAKAGGPIRSLFARRSQQRALIVTDRWIVGIDDGGLWRARKSERTATTLARVDAQALAVDDQFAYVSELGVDLVSRVSLSGGQPEPLTRFPHEPISLAVDDHAVYAAFNRGLASFPKQPSTPVAEPTLLVDQQLIFGGVVIYGDTILFANRAGLGREIWSVPKAGGEPALVFRSANVIQDGLALFGDTLFWTGGASEITSGEALALQLRTRQVHRLTKGLGLGRSPVADAENCYFVVDRDPLLGPRLVSGIAVVRYAP